MEELWILFVLTLWLTSNLYFLWSLEKRKPWAMEIAETIMTYEGFSPGNRKRSRTTTEPAPTEGLTKRPSCERMDVWTNWL